MVKNSRCFKNAGDSFDLCERRLSGYALVSRRLTNSVLRHLPLLKPVCPGPFNRKRTTTHLLSFFSADGGGDLVRRCTECSNYVLVNHSYTLSFPPLAVERFSGSMKRLMELAPARATDTIPELPARSTLPTVLTNAITQEVASGNWNNQCPRRFGGPAVYALIFHRARDSSIGPDADPVVVVGFASDGRAVGREPVAARDRESARARAAILVLAAT